eukprot:TRINITY_DN6558_c0_g1_i7.p3 TRINITY_DN6558_c0_g1~~TRINITY_DN6558_c0_g1_i7.p3  ORF type:complete len:103 (+),score=29.18 TRINITY_DN6558_c0_g1_i7:21-329(+)
MEAVVSTQSTFFFFFFFFFFPRAYSQSSSSQSSSSSSLSLRPSIASRLLFKISRLKKPQIMGSSTTGFGGATSTFLRLDRPDFTATNSSSIKSFVFGFSSNS